MKSLTRKEISRKLLLQALDDLQFNPDKTVIYPWRCCGLDDEIAGYIDDHLKRDFPKCHGLVQDFQRKNSRKVSLKRIYGDINWKQSEDDPHSTLISAPGFSSDYDLTPENWT